MDYYVPKKVKKTKFRKTEALLLGLVSIMLLLLLIKPFYSKLTEKFTEVELAYEEGYAINLNQNTKPDDIAKLLITGNYISNETDAKIISCYLVGIMKSEGKALPNLGALNKRSYMLPAFYADSIGGKELKERIQASLQTLNYDDTIPTLYQQKLPSSLSIGNDTHKITVLVQNAEKKPLEGVVVKLRHYSPSVEQGFTSEDVLSYYASTDANGLVLFTGLNKNSSYSVLPIKKWKEYGHSQGTTNGILEKDQEYKFTEKDHCIRLFGSLTYAQLKGDNTFTVRTPQEFKDMFFFYLVSFFLSWWIVHFYFGLRKKPFNEFILPCLMLLSGVCVLIMYATHDPLKDLLRGNEMVQGVMAGLFSLVILSEIDFVKFYNNGYTQRWNKWIRFDYLTILTKGRLKQGYMYLTLALILTILLLLFGRGPEGSGVKIELVFFQPSEIIKYLLIIFFAAYFSRNMRVLPQLPFRRRIWRMITLASVFFILLTIYILLGDMGPALVLCLTFILFYAITRGDIKELIIGVALFIALVWIGSHFLGSTTFILLIFILVWFFIYLAYCFIKKKLCESPLLLVLIILIFMFGNSLPGVGDRLHARNDIYSNIWNNNTYGGDQIAQGIWSLTSGGITGQGAGNGNSNVVPAFHTDMILTTIGEELGWIGLLLIIICLSILLFKTHNTIGRNAAHPFLFYLTTGIAIVIAVQFFIIAAGCIGVIPLTGITVPFLSYGRVSMILNIAVFGFVLSVSAVTGTKRQMKTIENYNNTVVLMSCTYALIFGFLLFCFLHYHLNSDYLVRPAFVVDKMGEKTVRYNPRINLLMKELKSGDVYDRNGLILATNEKNKIVKNKDIYIQSGIDQKILEEQLRQRQQRYYPFEEHSFFWIGNFNNRVLWGNENKGFFAESRHLSDLRGFNNYPKNTAFNVKEYKENRFTPIKDTTFTVLYYDYSELTPYLKAGIKSRKVRNFNEKSHKKDIWLTLDAQLQTTIQNNLKEELKKQSNRIDWRVSVVIVNAGSGEVLTSALYPLPKTSTLKTLFEMPATEQLEAINTGKIAGVTFTDCDLGLTYPTAPGSTVKVISGLAGLMKLGEKAVTKTYEIASKEIIRPSEPTGFINMGSAIEKSSNIYFIKLVNEEKLEEQLTQLYMNTGIRIGNMQYYGLYYKDDSLCANKCIQHWQKVYNIDRNNYFKQELNIPDPRYYSEFSQLARGQGQIDATPLAMARVTSIVANNGTFAPSQYILKSNQTIEIPKEKLMTLLPHPDAKYMQDWMETQDNTVKLNNELGLELHGKSGTPQRKIKKNGKRITINDGWYMFYVHSPKLKDPIAICVRIEQGKSSGNAVEMVKKAIIPALRKLKYID